MKNLLNDIGKKSKKAFFQKLNNKKKNKVLEDYCRLINKNRNTIINQNKKDIKEAQKKKIKDNMLQRLVLDDIKISNIINSIKKIIRLKDPTNVVLEKWKRPNGLTFQKYQYLLVL